MNENDVLLQDVEELSIRTGIQAGDGGGGLGSGGLIGSGTATGGLMGGGGATSGQVMGSGA
jgi:hypothetical protein